MNKTANRARQSLFVVSTAAILLIAGCGGGGGNNGCESIDPSRSANLPACGGTPATDPTSPSSSSGSITLALKNATGTATNTIAPDAPGTLEALVKDKSGNPVSGLAVSFLTTDKTGGFAPASGSALTNGSGVASITRRAGEAAGAFNSSAKADATGAASNSVGYTVVFPTLTLSALTINPTTLSAGGNASVSVTVLNGTAPYTASLPVTFSSDCATQGKATLSSPVVTQNGIAVSSYTDKGCGVADTITASVTLAGATTSKTGSINVLPATVGSISFVKADPANLALKGTGGPGRLENSVVTFKVVDSKGNPIVRLVDFKLDTTVGGLIVDPVSATSASDGTVSTVVKAGTINTPVRVIATVNGSSPVITSLSDELVVSSGVVDQAHFSLSTEIFNIEGWNQDGVCTAVTAFLTDHFGNPVPDGTAVSFTAEGGQIGQSCLTGRPNIVCDPGPELHARGTCSVGFKSANSRPADARISVMAYTLGEESFKDNPANVNGVNRFDVGEEFTDLREPFRYDRAITDAQANDVNLNSASTITPGTNEAYIDTDGNGVWNSTGDSAYNGVLQAVPNGKPKTVHVRQSLIQVLSTSYANITPLDPLTSLPLPEPITLKLPECIDKTPFVNKTGVLKFAIRDLNPTIFPSNTLPGNILPAGTKIEITTANGTIVSPTSYTVINTNDPSQKSWIYSIYVTSDATQTGEGVTGADGVKQPSYVCTNPIKSGLLTIKVTSPLGAITYDQVFITD
jgi:hypothetical protein